MKQTFWLKERERYDTANIGMKFWNENGTKGKFLQLGEFESRKETEQKMAKFLK